MIVEQLKPLLETFKSRGNLKIALLFGSLARGEAHSHSDIDLALYLRSSSLNEEISLIDQILMISERPINILRLDDEEESPFVVQEALKGKHLIEPDRDVLYDVYRRVLHEAESVHSRRERAVG